MRKVKNFERKTNLELIIKTVTLFVILLIFNSCSKPNYCECEDVSREAIKASAGLPSNVDFDKLEDCGEKIKNDIVLNIPAGQISIGYIQQVSYEMCKNGYYEGKGMDANKYYPKSGK